MKLKGSKLEFISQINRDGKGVTDLSNEDMYHLDDTVFKIKFLSLTSGTLIASEFNSYVVRIKKV